MYNFNLILSIIEATYVIYMLNFYKSKTNYADPSITFTNAFLAHPRTHSDTPISMVCPAGNMLSLVFASYLIGREYFPCTSQEEIMALKFINITVMIFGLAMSSMNLNVVFYLSPVFALEIIRLCF